MENQFNISELELRLKETQENREAIESRLKETQAQLELLNTAFEEDIQRLREVQQFEISLKEQIFIAQKNNIKDIISLQGLKKVLGDPTPFFTRLKNTVTDKAREVKELVDGTTGDRKWLDDRYEAYREICLQKGQEIKSREEFQKIALAVKEVDGQEEESSKLSDIANRFGQAKGSIKSVWQSLGVEEKIQNLRKSESILVEKAELENAAMPELSKKDIFTDWISSRNVKKDTRAKTDINELHTDYLLFVTHVYGEENLSHLTYSMKNGAFSAALNRHYEGLSQDKVKKTVGLRIKA